MTLTKVIEKKWTYTLYVSEFGYILSVVCGDVGLYELNMPLSQDEATKSLADNEYLDRLTTEIANNPHKFTSKSIPI